MMKQSLSGLTQRLFRRGQTGQTIVILAFGFIVLLGFVGIVTDVSLMFVRYSTLRRAIDAAAVSAAGQMRRVVPTPAEEAKAKVDDPIHWQDRAYGYAYARNITSVNLAARQFIELYGVSPSAVLVDTCATTPNDPQLECDPSKTPRKLVRVTAQVQSPTVFLRLLGWGTVTLEATAISETAVLDVVMVFDVSESMLNQTTYDSWDDVPKEPLGTGFINQSMRYYPPRLTYPYGGDKVIANYESAFPTGFATWTDAWNYFLKHTETDLYNYVDPAAAAANKPGYDAHIFRSIPFWVDGDGITVVPQVARNPTSAELANNQPREECRVRAFPAAEAASIMGTGTGTFAPDNDLQKELTLYMQNVRGFTGKQYPTVFDGFAPAYNYFGCCNDPNGNFEFTDLVCQPMRKVRDATEDFLDRIDFSRGDRVAFVTFDRFTYIIDPDGVGPLPAMMDSQDKALEMLHKVIGVRADPSYYADSDGNGFWDRFVVGGGAWALGNDPNVTKTKLIRYGDGDAPLNGGFNNTIIGLLNDYPVYNNCIFQNATLPYPRSLYSAPLADVPGGPYAYAQRYPTPLNSTIGTVMHPPLPIQPWAGQVPADKINDTQMFSYELRAACRGTNVGAALRTANNVFNDPATSRTNGAVWVMVMLGDGAAAGSDPVRRNQQVLKAPQVYNATVSTNLATSPNVAPIAGDYGVYGVCPYGTVANHNDAPLLNGWDFKKFPFCSDENPASRNFCFRNDDKHRDAEGNLFIDIGDSAECTDWYDTDDFARDWADFVGLDNRTDSSTQQSQLPTIFTIGFGLDFQRKGLNWNDECQLNIEDCLGEELLRYIADVGDNNHVDTDYQQDWRGNNKLDKILSIDDDWGVRGPCENPIKDYANPNQIPIGSLPTVLVNPKAHGEHCGNYFNAPDENELKVVFDTIASRMFTRLSR